MKKRILSMVTILCLLIALFPVKVFAYDIWDYLTGDEDRCFIGVKNNQTYCGDTYFTTPISDEDIDSVYFIFYDDDPPQEHVLTPDESGRYKLEAGLGKINVKIRTPYGMGVVVIVTINADHTDSDDNHVCDVCGDRLTNKCADYNMDHRCDTCEAQMGTCEDADHDHRCDYGCGKTFGKCEDADHNHKCDYGCGMTFGKCEDADHDHECDYGCGKTFGEHKAADGTHTCSYCGQAASECKDETPKDHKCDICGTPMGTCEDADHDHLCDYGCGKTYGTCEDADHNHKCDYGCGVTYGTCEDADHDHECDYGCGKTFGEHKAADGTHTCGYCSQAVSECKDETPKDHKCDICGATLSSHSGGTATCKDKAICDYCGNEYGEVDSSNHTGGTEVCNAKEATCTEDGYTGDTYCKGCGDKLSNGTTIKATGHKDTDKNHICDVETCKATISDCGGGTATCTKKAVCEYCGKEYGEIDPNNHVNVKHVARKEATEYSKGNIEYWYCQDCGKYYSNQSLTKEITQKKTVIPALTESPKTGDESHVATVFFVTASTGAALAFLFLLQNRKRGKYEAR